MILCVCLATAVHHLRSNKVAAQRVEGQQQWTISSKLLGRGAYGKVYEGMDLVGNKVAIKSLETKTLPSELQLLRQLNHKHVIQYLGHFELNGSLHIVMEYASGGSVLDLLATYGTIPMTVTVKYTREALLGLEYLHQQGIVHRDIKPANLLVHEGCLKISDLGEAKQLDDGTQTVCGTPFYMAPEVMHGQAQPASDIWSLGATVLHMLTGAPPQWDNCATSALVLVKLVQGVGPTVPDSLHALARGFVRPCLRNEAAARPTCRELLAHAFLNAASTDLGTPPVVVVPPSERAGSQSSVRTPAEPPASASWGRTLSGSRSAFH